MIFVIKSAASEAVLEFGKVEGQDTHVTLSSGTYSASKDVHLYPDPSEIASFLQSCAANWRGWEGAREWESLEGDLRISAETDKLGHVQLSVSLAHQMGQPDPWRLEAVLMVEAGQLDSLSRNAARHFPKATAV